MSDKTQMDRMEDLLTQLIGNVASNRSDLVELKNDMAGFRTDMVEFRNDMENFHNDFETFRSEVNERLDRIEAQQALADKRLSVQRDDIANLRERVGVIERG